MNQTTSATKRRRWISLLSLYALSQAECAQAHDRATDEGSNIRRGHRVVHARRVESSGGLPFAEPFSLDSGPILPGTLQGKNLTRSEDEPRTPPSKETRIIGGTIVPKGRYPYLVALFYKDINGYLTHVCGGSLISPHHVLTAAHCIENTDVLVTGLYDYRNVPTQSYERYDVNPNSVLVYPTYTSRNLDGDLAIIVLNSPSRFSTITLNVDRQIPETAQLLTAMGWGYRENKQTTSIPYETDVRHVDTSICRFRWGSTFIKPSMLCASGPDGGDTCQGDSGGPLIQKGRAPDGSQDILVGATSWGAECSDQYYPGVYARISECYEWIAQIVPGLETGETGTVDDVGNDNGNNDNTGGGGGGGSEWESPGTTEEVCKRENCWYFFWYAWCDNTCDR